MWRWVTLLLVMMVSVTHSLRHHTLRGSVSEETVDDHRGTVGDERRSLLRALAEAATPAEAAIMAAAGR